MQWLLLAFTFVVMAVVQPFARGGPVEARATLALGFVTAAAYLAGTIAQRLRLPRIIGYLLAGFVAGPAWLGLLRGDELQALGPIATGALALIAFAAGSELTLDAFRGDRRLAIVRIVTGTMAAPFVAVALVVLTVSPWFPLTAHQPFRDALAVALALGTLAAVASPTLSWAVMNDAEAVGPLSRTTLDVTIVQDILAVVLLIVVLALALPLASDGAVTPGIAGHTLLILTASIMTGAALGVAAAQYLRSIGEGKQLAWVLVVLAFLVAQAVRLAGLDAVLIALAAGCALRNVVPAQSERLRGELKRCALPVYVVFFALAGSALQLDALGDIWPWALLLAGLRITGLRAGLRWAGRDAAVAPEMVRYGWAGLVSQGGLAVTLAAVLRRAFPEWNVSLEALLVAMIGVHQLAGPICFHWALRRTGELTEARGVHVQKTPDPAAGAAVAVSGGGL
jgi:Kef-type K+ transport system membrane component KefB